MPLFKDRQASPASLDIEDAGLTLVDEDIVIVGEIVSEENIRLRGRVEGNVSTSGSVVIEPQDYESMDEMIKDL